MTADEVRAALAAAGVPAPAGGHEVRPIEGGSANWTFDVDGGWIVRFPRTDLVAASTARELVLLPALQDALPFAVPALLWHGRHAGRPWLGYRRITGEAIDRLDPVRDAALAVALGRGLAALHAFPIERARGLLGGAATPAAWAARYEALRGEARARLQDVLDAADASRLERAIDVFIAQADAFVPALVHGDLGPEHVLVDGWGRFTGIIDWEDAAVGDPAIDFAGLWGRLGATAARAVLAAYGRGGERAFERRVQAYAWIAVVHDLLHAVAAGDRDATARAAAALRRRLAAKD